MEFIRLGKTDMWVSKLSLGTWEMGGDSVWADESDRESVRIIREGLEHGINFIDTAPLYGRGHSEELIASAVNGRRNEYIIATKCGLNWENRGNFQFERDGVAWCVDFSPQGLRRDLESSLERLGTDYVDLYYTHRPVPPEQTDEVLDTMMRFRQEGKIRAIGLSNMTRATYDAFVYKGMLDAVQLKYSLLDPEYGEQYFESCQANGVVYQAFSALARGILTGRLGRETVVENQAHKAFGWFQMERREDLIMMLENWKKTLCPKYRCSLASLALAWTMGRCIMLTVLFGVRRIENLYDTLQSTQIKLEQEDVCRMESDARLLIQKYKQEWREKQ